MLTHPTLDQLRALSSTAWRRPARSARGRAQSRPCRMAGDSRFARLFRMLVKIDLLVLDDWGPDRLSANQRRDFMEIVEDRHGRGSILITSQLPVPSWHEVIAEPTLADAILDRIVHNAYRLELDGPSMRKLKASDATEPAPSGVTTATENKASRGAK